MKTKYFFAVDIGASSGRTILASLTNGKLDMTEVTRFSNPLVEVNGHFYWNILSLYDSIIEGLRKVAKDKIHISSIGIDTWGVDFVAVDKNNELLGNPYSYRDPQTIDAPAQFFKEVSRKDVYKATGIQIMNFNSLFQFYTLDKNDSIAYKNAEKLVFMPDALSFLLTGKIVTEYTIASTAQILNPYTKKMDTELLSKVGLSEDKFGRFVMPGTIIGNLTESVCQQTGLPSIPVVAVAGHDTASAVAAIPATDPNFAYISSGTWSLMGVELEEPIVNEETYKLNFTNEGGVDGTIRFLKNICGMWLLERCRAEWGRDKSYQDLITDSQKCTPFKYLINPDDPLFANPLCMTTAIDEYCDRTNQGTPQSVGEYVRCIFESLALRYKQVLDSLQNLVPFKIERLHVIGGGSKNQLLNQFTANALNIPLVVGPSEATAIGNILMQAKALDLVDNLSHMREIIADSEQAEKVMPLDVEIWNEAYNKFLTILKYHEKIRLSAKSI